MRGNDIDNRPLPRDLVVWEGLLGILPDPKTVAAEEKLRRRKKWAQAVTCYQINEMMARKINDLIWRMDLDIDLLTYLGPEFAKALEDRLEKENMLISTVQSWDPHKLARKLAVMPEIRNIYDPDPAHQFTYGSKGRVFGPDDYLMLGAM